jgi:hypothetical protein
MCGRLLAPVSLRCCGKILPATLTSACVLLPVPWEAVLITGVCVERTLWVCLVGSKALVALPRAAIRLGWQHQGHLACAFGRGCG